MWKKGKMLVTSIFSISHNHSFENNKNILGKENSDYVFHVGNIVRKGENAHSYLQYYELHLPSKSLLYGEKKKWIYRQIKSYEKITGKAKYIFRSTAPFDPVDLILLFFKSKPDLN